MAHITLTNTFHGTSTVVRPLDGALWCAHSVCGTRGPSNPAIYECPDGSAVVVEPDATGWTTPPGYQTTKTMASTGLWDALTGRRPAKDDSELLEIAKFDRFYTPREAADDQERAVAHRVSELRELAGI